jgi:hypothetical protein
MSSGRLYRTRAGRHTCYDRVVFDVLGTDPISYVVRYVPEVTADGSGEPVPVPGRGKLEVIVRAPVLLDEEDNEFPSIGGDLVPAASLRGWDSLRAVRFAGSFEGQSTIAVGVDAERPFRVWIMKTGTARHVVVDIAH